MVEDIKGLIEKIHQEGVKAAEEKAKDIENNARHQSEEIIAQAKKSAEVLINDAREEIARMQKASQVLLEQAGRDLLLSLKTEISAMLNRVIVSQAQEALGSDELNKLITMLVKNAEQGEIIISLNQKDLQKLGKGFLRKLSDTVKKGITLKPAKDISAGFIISYDGGKSHFDFSDKGLAEYLGNYLKPELAKLLQKAGTTSKKTGKQS